MTKAGDPLGPYRGRLLGLAYRMLGSRTEAEDVLQDAWLRYSGVDRETVRNEEAFFVTTVTRLCLDRLKSARARREIYVGPWLPEPVFDTEELSPHSAVELADDLSFALLLTLQRLSATERAAFLLHDVFDTPFAEVAETLGKSEAACRQLAARARKAVAAGRPEKRPPPEQHRALLDGFIAAMQSGDAGNLKMLLAADAVAMTDGGGVKRAALNPIRGADHVARFFAGLMNKLRRRGQSLSFEPATINGEPALAFYIEGELDQTVSIAIDDGLIRAVYAVRNPEKLRAPGARVH